jgi:hypothetical protein
MRKLFTFLPDRSALILRALFVALFFFSGAQVFAQTTGFVKCYADKDRDGFGDPNDFILVDVSIGCNLFGPDPRSDNGLDCNDNDASIHPYTWYKDFDNDLYSDGTTLIQCTQPLGYKLATVMTMIRTLMTT